MVMKVVDEDGSMLITLRLPTKLVASVDKLAEIHARVDGRGKSPNRSATLRSLVKTALKQEVAAMKKKRTGGGKSKTAKKAKKKRRG